MIAVVAHLARRFGAPVPPVLPPAAEPDAGATEPPAACGWFDSSHELRAGLVIVEHANADAVAAQLPLEDWLALHLGTWQAPANA
jgi:hypothetical protein